MRWVLHIAAYVRYLLWGLNHKKREYPSVFEDEFLGYEAYSFQTFLPTGWHKELDKPSPLLLRRVRGAYDSTLIKKFFRELYG
ncbi:MAG: hypothetical protein AB1480_12545 [Nitrospirota bacterium]